MEAVLTPYPRDHKTNNFATNNQNRIKFPKKNTRSKFISSNPYENFNTYEGLLNSPPQYPNNTLSSSSSSSYQHKKQPPLLPLPNVSPIIQHQLMMFQSVKGRRNRSRHDLSLISLKSTKHTSSNGKNMDLFSEDLVFNLSPPPSSLPLPNFSVKSKFSCNKETSTPVDTGATDHLRRLLGLL
ncbi:hypothetical protein TanjilG_17675 [Lupinus angustifolius]|uniref:Uncharacterized protein n=1 Tax=Lupinus angustifolius TaxID=3871 RepID=A0A1J7HWZ1_LUPAN|nr:PREDICTED: uncharacterized protein LOC109354159 [Lupinus angustifolius]OIW06301.1 hypothetical protein TanjilG_17675 [Lupinus angustifolius]